MEDLPALCAFEMQVSDALLTVEVLIEVTAAAFPGEAAHGAVRHQPVDVAVDGAHADPFAAEPCGDLLDAELRVAVVFQEREQQFALLRGVILQSITSIIICE